MSMSIRQVINALMDAEDLDKECIIEVNKNMLPKSEYSWLQIHIDKVVNCAWGSAITAEEGDPDA